MAPAAADFLPVEIVAAAPPPCEAAARAGEIVIALPGERRIRVDRPVASPCRLALSVPKRCSGF